MLEATRTTKSPGPGAATLLTLALPSLLFAGFDLARRSYLPLFLTADIGFSMSDAALLVALTGAWGVLIEFAMSAMGDSASGRRSPRVFWMVSGTAVIIAATLGLQIFSGRSDPLGIAILLMALITGWTLCNVTHGAWALETGRDAQERSAIFGLRGFFAIAGSAGFAVLAAVINRGAAGVDAGSPFIAIMIVTGLGIPFLHTGLILRLGRQPGLPARPFSLSAAFEPMKAVLGDAAGRRLALLYALVGLNSGVGTATFLIVAREGLGVPAWADLILGLSTAAAAIGTLASARWGALWRSERMLRLLLLAKAMLGLALLAIPQGRPELLALWAMASGAVAAFNLLALRLLLGEALDRGEAQAARSQGAMFYAAFHIPLNIGLAAGGALALAALGWAGLDPATNRFGQTSYWAVAIPAIGLALSGLMAVIAVLGLDRCQPINARNSMA
jgi:Na+/melibiose symporter-like transporter